MLRGTAWLDLSAGPVVLSVPDTGGRLYTLTLVDLWNDAFAVLGKRSTGTAKGNTVLVPPGWSGTLPSGMPRIDAPTTHVLARLLIQADGPAEYPAVHALQDGFVITPLSQWNLPPQAQRGADGALNMKVSPREQVESLPTDALFAYAAELLRGTRHTPPTSPYWPGCAARLIPGRPFDFDKLDHPASRACAGACGRARAHAAAAGATLREANGWQREAGGVGVYGNAYMRRALAAQAQPGASLPEDLTTLLLAADSRGEAVDGSRRYHLRFASGQLPPAGAFWSLAAYDAQGLLAPNALNRQALGSRDPLRATTRTARWTWSSATKRPRPSSSPTGCRCRPPDPRNCCCASTSPARRCWTDSGRRHRCWRKRRRRSPPRRPRRRRHPRPTPPRDRGKRASGFRHDRHIVRPGDPAGQTGGPGQGQAASTVPAGPLTGGVAAVPAQAWPAPSAREKTAARPASRYHIHFSNQERPTWTTPSATNCR